jgi:hypothetical protein
MKPAHNVIDKKIDDRLRCGDTALGAWCDWV